MEDQISIKPTTMNSSMNISWDDVIMNSETPLALGNSDQVVLDPELNVILYDDPLCMMYEPNPYLFALPNELLVKIMDYIMTGPFASIEGVIPLFSTCKIMYNKKFELLPFVRLEIEFFPLFASDYIDEISGEAERRRLRQLEDEEEERRFQMERDLEELRYDYRRSDRLRALTSDYDHEDQDMEAHYASAYQDIYDRYGYEMC